MRQLLTAAVIIVLCICHHAAKAQKKVVIIGSSTSACYNLSNPGTECYPNRLNAYYDTQAPFGDTSFDNSLARGGYTVYRGMPSSYVSPYSDPNFQSDPTVNITKALSMNPNIVLVNYPTNGFNTLPLDSILFCFRTIRDSANKKGVPCFITTTQPRMDAGFTTPAIKRKLADLKDSILLEFGRFAIDFYTGMFNAADSNLLPAYNSGDNIHFNAAGHAVLAQRVESANVFASGLLPATFLGYNASYNGIGTLISWSTAKEVDVAHYDIQRSTDGIVFSSIGDVDPRNAQGSYSYQFTDRTPPGGWSYYKIVIVDRDGRQQFSPVLKAFSNAGRLTLKRLLNQPSQIILQLQSGETLDAGIQVMNSTGQLLQKSNHRIETGVSSVTIATTGLGSGIYYIKLITAAGPPIVTSFIKN